MNRRLPILQDEPADAEADVSEWSPARLEAFAAEAAARSAAERRSAIARRTQAAIAEQRALEATVDPLERVRRKIDRLGASLTRPRAVQCRPSIAVQVARVPAPVPRPPKERKPRELTEKQAQTLKLYEEGKSGPEIAAATESSVGAVHSCLQVLRLRGLLKRAKSSRGRPVQPEEPPKETLSAAQLDAAIARARAKQAGGSEATVYERDVERDAPVPRAPRPERRGDCLPGGHNEMRPCPWASCRYHLGVDVSETGALHLNFPDREPWDLPHSCALDMADQGGMTLEEVSKGLGLTRERIRQIEGKALDRLQGRKTVHRSLHAFTDAERGAYNGLGIGGSGGEAEANEAPPPEAHAPKAEEGDELDDVRAGRAVYSAGRPPRFGSGDEADGYADAELAWFWEQMEKWRLERAGRAPDGSALEVLHGVPLSPRAAQAVHFIRQSWAERGTGLTALELADLCEVQGSTEESRRAGIGTLLQGVREAGLVIFTRAHGAQLVEPKAKEAKSDAADSSRGDGDGVAKPNAGRRGRDASHEVARLRGGGERHRAGPLRDEPADSPRRPSVLAGRERPGVSRAPDRGAVAPARVFVCPVEGPAELVEEPAPEEPPVIGSKTVERIHGAVEAAHAAGVPVIPAVKQTPGGVRRGGVLSANSLDDRPRPGLVRLPTLPRGFDFEAEVQGPPTGPSLCAKVTVTPPQREETEMADEAKPLTEKQQRILDAYETGASAVEVAEQVGTTRSSVDTVIYLLRKRGLVKRAKSPGGRRPNDEPTTKATRAPKARSAKVRVQTKADVRASKPLADKDAGHAVFAALSGTTKGILRSAKERIAEIDAKIGPLVAERARLASIVEMLGG